ncbi:MAG: hypothetical protein J5857_00235 [Treponema sp.]|nr:hypothetical protein [Treponema sp.]
MKTIREVMDMPVENLELSVRCVNCLKNMNIKTLSQLTAKKEEDFGYIRNMGKKSMDLLKNLVSSLGMCFGMTERDWLQWGLMNKGWILSH